MKLHRPHILYILTCLWLFVSPLNIGSTWAKDFIVIISAGYGGHDPGAIGKISKEGSINLEVALKLGNQIKQNCNDVKVVYTRSKDVFIPLDHRIKTASNVKADLFIPIHTNALVNSRIAKDASTWTSGLAKSDANLKVAKRENSVTLYKDDYKTRYASFSLNSVRSYIISEFMQDEYMGQGVHLASLAQKRFRHHYKRIDRGAHQAGFLVLRADTVPSTLAELGFTSAPEEEHYLNTDEGTATLAKEIYRVSLVHKREHEIHLTSASHTILPNDDEEATEAPVTAQTNSTQEKAAERPKNSSRPKGLIVEARTQHPIATESTTNDSEVMFKIQILTSPRPLAKNDRRLKGLKDVGYHKESGIYKYTYGASPDYNKMLRTRCNTVASLFKDTFIIAFCNGEKVSINGAVTEFKKRRSK